MLSIFKYIDDLMMHFAEGIILAYQDDQIDPIKKGPCKCVNNFCPECKFFPWCPTATFANYLKVSKDLSAKTSISVLKTLMITKKITEDDIPEFKFELMDANDYKY